LLPSAVDEVVKSVAAEQEKPMVSAGGVERFE
jgi:hypothetical protein